MADEFLYQTKIMSDHPADGKCACDPYQGRWCAFHADFDEKNPNSPASVRKHSKEAVCGVCGGRILISLGHENICPDCIDWSIDFFCQVSSATC